MQYHAIPSTYRRSTNQIVAANHVFVVDVNDHFVLVHDGHVQHFLPQRFRPTVGVRFGFAFNVHQVGLQDEFRVRILPAQAVVVHYGVECLTERISNFKRMVEKIIMVDK